MRYANTVIMASLVLLLSTFASRADAQDGGGRAILVLDASGSMWGQIEGRTKIEIAREVIGGLMAEWDPSIHLGLIAYGHRRKGDCSDIETLVPVGPVNPATIKGVVDNINPKGKTPLSAAVQQAAKDLRFTEERATVIVVSDGKETCGVDPCALGRQLEELGIEFTVHVVGFDVTNEEKAQLRCLAENTGGKFLSADTASELTEALTQVAEIATKEVVPPPAPDIYFEDNFDGEMLAEHWEVVNADAETYVVENGALLVIYQDEATIGSENIPNFLRLKKQMPKGDWRATIRFQPEFQTLREVMLFGLYQDPGEYTLAQWLVSSWCCYARNLSIKATKNSGGKKAEFVEAMTAVADLGEGNFDAYRGHFQGLGEGILLRLTKKGRSYVFAGRVEGKDENGKPFPWIELSKLTSLRQKGDLVFAFTQAKGGGGHVGSGGESLVNVDWVKIETVN